MRKRCSKCGKNRLKKFFSKKRNGLSANCSFCQKEYWDQYYRRNRKQHIARSAIHAASRRNRLRRLVQEAKNKPCVDCGESYPYYVMQFDHRPGAKKVAEIAVMLRLRYSEQKIVAEIDKCDVVCANCHCERTHQRRLGVSFNGRTRALQA